MAQLGNNNRFYIKIGSSSNYTWLAGEQNNSVNRTQEAIEVSDKSTIWTQYIAGKKGATIDGTIHADNSDAAQVAILQALHTGQDVQFFIGQLSSDAPSDGELGSAVVTSIGDTNDFGAVASRSISLTVNGALTHYPAFTQAQAQAQAANPAPAASDPAEPAEGEGGEGGEGGES